MVSYKSKTSLGDGTAVVESYGLSTDTKPTANIANGSAFVEMDTGGIYFFDQTGAAWKKF